MDIPSEIDKSARSVFVGNIPYEATEEKLKDIFSEVGPVTSFKLVYDRENGKPKGYGFCEYKDADMAQSAMRNLNGYEIEGRTLRVDNACTEKNRLELGAKGESSGGAGGTGEETMECSPYGEPVHPDRAPETISNAVASLPPEQLLAIISEMKTSVLQNPEQAHRILNQNPQLAYALLQITVIMRAIDPESATSLLHPNPPKPPVFHQQPQYNNNKQIYDGNSNSSYRDFRSSSSSSNHRRSAQQQPPSSSSSSHDHPRSHRSHHRNHRGFGDKSSGPSTSRMSSPGAAFNDNDPEKAQLIMQVLQLTDQQIALLPSEQRQSILELKSQMNSK